MKFIAQFVSYLLHPLLMPLYILYLLFNSSPVFAYIPQEARFYAYEVTALVLLLLPLASLPLFKRMKLIRGYGLQEKQERVYPILVAVGCGFVGFWLIGRVPGMIVIQQLYLVLIILLSGFSIVTLRWKMSMHMTAIGGACGFLIVMGSKYLGEDIRYLLMMMLLAAGILGACRLYLNKHNPLQVYVGFFFGLIFVVGILN